MAPTLGGRLGREMLFEWQDQKRGLRDDQGATYAAWQKEQRQRLEARE